MLLVSSRLSLCLASARLARWRPRCPRRLSDEGATGCVMGAGVRACEGLSTCRLTKSNTQCIYLVPVTSHFSWPSGGPCLCPLGVRQSTASLRATWQQVKVKLCSTLAAAAGGAACPLSLASWTGHGSQAGKARQAGHGLATASLGACVCGLLLVWLFWPSSVIAAILFAKGRPACSPRYSYTVRGRLECPFACTVHHPARGPRHPSPSGHPSMTARAAGLAATTSY